MQKFHHSRFYIVVIFLSLILLLAVRSLNLVANLAAADTILPQQVISQAWELARESGSYTYHSQVNQTTYPAPSLTNVGRQPQEERLTLSGSVDTAQELVELTIWQGANVQPGNGIAIRIEDGKAYGRSTTESTWQPIDNVTNIFAPGNDPLGLLASAANIQEVGAETRQLGNETLTYTRYTFELDSIAYANQLQREMENHLQQFGALPAGLRLQTAEHYRNATGQGEIWLNASGLPARFTIQLTLPPHGDSGKITVDVTTDFANFAQAQAGLAEASFWSQPLLWLDGRLPQHSLQEQLAPQIAIWLMVLALALLTLKYWRSHRFYVALTLVITISMLLTPLLQGQQAHAFAENLNEYLIEQEAAATSARIPDAPQESWDPHQNPFAVDETQAVLSIPEDGLAKTAVQTTSLLDSDGDGLDDALEAAINTDPYNSDSDGDGLDDGVEYNILGTDPRTADHDGDGISDLAEVTPFEYNGRTWYMNPLRADTNGDGLIDGLECFERSALADTPDETAVCPDTDNDGIPDLFDFDNDGDGIHDKIDLSPMHVAGPFQDNNPFRLTIQNLQTDRPVFVTLQIRPTDEKHLTYFGNVLDWPTGDTEGQIQRHLDTTFANTALADIRSNDPKAANGDVRLTPVLELAIPYQSGHYGNLPVLPGAPARTPTLALDQWLDITELDRYGISVHQVDETSGDLVAYLPLSIIADETGGGLAAFTTQMVYWPSQAGWGSNQEMRLLWMVQKIKDECTSTAVTGECLLYEDTGIEVIHIYDDEWTLTGLDVKEDHGMAVATIAEDPALDNNLNTDEHLWHLAHNLSLTFSEGVDCIAPQGGGACTRDNQREMTVAEIYQRWNHASNGGVSDEARFNITDMLVVNQATYPHSGYVAQMAMNDTAVFLNGVFAGYETATNPTLLFAREETFRATNLADATLNGGTYALDFNVSAVQTMGYLSWSPYNYRSGSWVNYEISSYLDYLKLRLADHTEFQPADTSEESADVVAGQLFAAQMFYLTLYNGLSAQVEYDGFPVETDDINYDLYSSEPTYSTEFLAPLREMAMLHLYRALATRIAPPVKEVKSFWSALGKWQWGNYVRTKIHRGTQSANTFKHINLLNDLPTGNIGKTGTAVVGLAVVGFTVAAVANNDSCHSVTDCDAIAIATAGASTAMTAVETVHMVNKLVRGYQSVSGFSNKLTEMIRVTKGFDFASAVGLIVELTVIWTLFALSGASMAAAAFAIAATVVALLLFAIGFIPIVGQLFLLLVAFVDAISLIICEAFGLSGRGCEGATGNLTAVLADLLYDVNEIVDLSDPQRLELTYEDVRLQDLDTGYTTGNSIIVSMAITNTIARDDRLYVYQHEALIGDIARDYTRATFVYHMQTAQTDQHASLDLNQMRDAWQIVVKNSREEGDIVTEYGDVFYTEVISAVVDLNGVGAGINQNLGPLYLAEAFASPYEECLAGQCKWRRTRATAHYEVGENLIFDILPPTLDDFYALSPKNGGFALSWGQESNVQFPRLQDADGDGLLNPTDGGTDSDDTGWDRDGDGLSDVFELEQGTNPSVADTDGDGLNDALELFLGTNPRLADSDGDGLRDADELAGWPIRYGFAADGVTPLYARVWSDPLAADGDGDGLTDYAEFILGLHPGIPDNFDVQDALAFSQSELNEVGAPTLLLRFEEKEEDTVIFHDDSGNQFEATCDDTNCPAYGQLGRYGTAASFDGIDDHLSLPFLADPGTSLTAAAWFNVTAYGTGATILQQNNGSGTGRTWLNVNGDGRVTTSLAPLQSTVVPTNEWHHAAVTYDGAIVTLYLDGQSVGSVAAIPPGSDGVMLIGVNKGGSDYFAGMLDEMVVFDWALTAVEINDVMNGRYNPNDLRVQPGAELAHQVTVTNTLNTNHVGVTLFTEADVPLTLNTLPQTFPIPPQQTHTLNNTVQVPLNTLAGSYAVNTVAEGAIVSSDESATFRTFPAPEADANFEPRDDLYGGNNSVQQGWRLNYLPDSGNQLFANCDGFTGERGTEHYGTAFNCPTIVDQSGISGRGLAFDGQNDNLLLQGPAMTLNSTPLTVAGWVYPTHDAAETNKRGIFGFYEPRDGWFRFEETSVSGSFSDANGNRVMTCVGSCPTPGQDGRFGNAALFNNTMLVRNLGAEIESGFTAANEVHFSFWFKRSNTSGGDRLIALRSGNTSSLNLNIWNDGRLELFTRDNFTGKFSSELTTATFNDTNWHHVYFTSDGNTRLYIDGVERLAFNFDDDFVHPGDLWWDQNTQLYLGGYHNGADFQGTIDEFYFGGWSWEALKDFTPADMVQHGFRTFPSLYAQGDQLGFWAMPQGHDRSFEVTAAGLELNRWNHVAFTYDGSSSYTLYLNGAPVQQFSESPIYMPLTYDYGAFARLGWIGGGFDFFEGQADAFKVYQQQLSAAEIASLATNTFNENLYAIIDFEEVPSTTEFQFDHFTGGAATCAGSDCPTVGARGIVNRAAYFDGDDALQFVSTASPSGSGYWEGMSISTWVKSGSDGTIVDYVIGNPGFEDAFTLTTDSFYVNGGSVSFTNLLPVDEWAHLVAVWQESVNGGDELRIYINGVEVASQAIAYQYSISTNNDPPIFVGSDTDGSNHFTGYLDDLRIYSMPLSDADVLDIYTRSAPLLNLQFDEDAGATTLHDTSPNDYDATSAANTGLPGRIGNSVNFNDGYVTVPNAAALNNLTDTVTLMAWVKPADLNGVQRIMGHGGANDATGDGLGLYLNNNVLGFAAHGLGTFDSSATLVENEWQHVALVIDRLQNAYFYVNGMLQDVVSTGVTPLPNSNNDDFLIGSAQGPVIGTLPWQPFYGQIDEVTVYGRTLSGLEVEDRHWLDWRWFREQGYFDLVVDTDKPAINLLTTTTVFPNSYNMLAVEADDVNGARLFEWGIRPSGGSFTWQTAFACGFNKWCPDFDASTIGGEGQYELQFRVVDLVGHETVSAIYTIYVDGTGPQASSSYSDTWVAPQNAGSKQWTVPLTVSVAEPALSGGTNGSGVEPDSVWVTLLTPNGTPVGQPTRATDQGGSWALDYPFYNFAPSGLYQIQVAASDLMGNSSSTIVGTVLVDAQPPSAKLNPEVVPGDVISDTAVFSGVVVEQPEWGGIVAEYHFESGVDSFIDHGGSGHTATCISCPTAASGLFSNALAFDGSQYVTVPYLFDPAAAPFTVAVWFKPDDTITGKTLVQQEDGSGIGRTWLKAEGSRLHTFLGGSALDGPANMITANVWHHAAVSYDGTTLRLYLDGELLAAEDRLLEASDGNIRLGMHKIDDYIAHKGQMDAVYFFDRALLDNEIFNLGRRDFQGVQAVDVWLEPLDVDTQNAPPADTGWQAASVSEGSWSQTVPAGMEWFYQTHLRSSDGGGNGREEGIVWRGTIDNVAPRITTFAGELIGSGTAAQTEYTFTVSDFLLDAASLSQPCSEAELTISTYTADAESPLENQTYEISATCRVPGHDDGTTELTSCDLGGLCTTQTVNLTTSTEQNNVVITNPVHGSVISTTLPVVIEGGAFAPNGIDQVSVTANGVPVDAVSLGGVTDSPWSVDWFPTEPGAYTLTAVMTDTLNNSFSNSINVTLTGYVLEVSKSGSGGGTVSSDLPGINCGSDCAATYAPDTAVTLTAVPDTGSGFNGWSGACSGFATTCQVMLDQMQSVMAEFALPQVIVQPTNVTLSETGVTSQVLTLSLAARPSGIVSINLASSDTSECTVFSDELVLDPFNWQTGVTTTINSVDDNLDDGDQTCTIVTSAASSSDPLYNGLEVANITVMVIDDDTSFMLEVVKTGTGSGTVSSDLPGIDCGSDCEEAYVENSVVTLTAAPDSGSAFNGWGGACSGTFSCQVTMSQARSVTAEFALPEIIVQPTHIVLTETGVTSQSVHISLAARPSNTVSFGVSSSDPTECNTFTDEYLLFPFEWQTGISIPLTSVDDDIDDGDQTCTIFTTASSADPLYHGLAMDDVIVTVIDDDGAPSINFSAVSYTAVESQRAVTATITLSNPSAETVSVTVSSADGTATAGLDYTAVNQIITFAPLQTSATATVLLLDDALDEATETLNLTLSAPQNSELGLNTQVVVEILDDDAPPTLSVADSSAEETDGPSTLTFTVQLSAPSGQAVTVDYETVDGTAVAGTHYTATIGTLTFAPGQTSQTITVPIMGDDELNEDRHFQVSLSAPGNATLAHGTATGTIIDDDLAFVYLPLVVNNYPQGPDLIVESLRVNGSEIEVVIKNVGDMAVINEFWVDVYINPAVPPTAVNDIVDTTNGEGSVWAVKNSALPLAPGQMLTLTLGDDYYAASVSKLTLPVPAGLPVFAQVDSASSLTNYGAVLESHERLNQPYNNILESRSQPQ